MLLVHVCLYTGSGHLLHTVRACGLTNQQPKNSLVCSLSLLQDLRRNEVKFSSMEILYYTESITSVMMTQEVSPHESSCLANCRFVRVSVHSLYGPSKKQLFVPVASALTGTPRDCLIVASYGQEPEIQRLVSRNQIVSADLL